MRTSSTLTPLATGLMLALTISIGTHGRALGQATPVEQIKVAKGFKVELLYDVPSDKQGSWVSLTSTPKGTLITSDQYGKLYEVTPPPIGSSTGTKVEQIKIDIGSAQGLLWAFDSLYVVVNGQGSGLYRVQDSNGDGSLDKVTKLREFKGGGEHGPHAVILSPDGKSLYVCGGNHTDIPNPETSRVPRNWAEDQLLPRMWDAGGHAVGKMAPGGWIAKTDPDGKSFELVCSGFRNEYDIAFNQAGELFTYDADMEWDVGAPWYRPTRVNHCTSGAEFGWRSGTGKFPEYYADSLGSVVDIGPGCPTGIAFGTGAKFPEKYQRALFICDWSYGVLYAVHMTPRGSTYVGEAERFVYGTPLQLTDLAVNPKDGALYFTIGGRRTSSGFYRITYSGKESTKQTTHENRANGAMRSLRKTLETLHKPGQERNLDFAWKNLGHEDRPIRFAARIALEHMKVDAWQDKALSESNTDKAINAAIALARNAKVDGDTQGKLIKNLNRIDWGGLKTDQQLALVRAYALTFIRLGTADEAVKNSVAKKINGAYPSKNESLNRELAQLLIYLEAPGVAGRTLALLKNAPTQEEQLHYGLALRALKSGWTLAEHEEYFAWFNKAAGHRGGHSFNGFLRNIRNETIARLSDDEKKSLAKAIANTPDPGKVSIIEPRKFVKKWTVSELLAEVKKTKSGRNFEQGRAMFSQAACFKCHRFDRQGGLVGPDLSAVGRRYNDLNLVESLIEPNKVISDQYEATTFVLDNGKSITGRVVNLVNDQYLVSENMLDPGKLTGVKTGTIEEKIPSKVSMMPASLLDTLTKEEILDLIAYLRSGGDRDHALFKK
jgi:putative heme-binding domain-containing protein